VIFIDTSAWYASEVEDDKNHDNARRFSIELRSGKYGILVTTDYVLDESITLLRMRKGLDVALKFADKISGSRSVKIIWIDEPIFNTSIEILSKSKERRWSFTDCASFAVMQQLGIRTAFAFDENFREYGLEALPRKST